MIPSKTRDRGDFFVSHTVLLHGILLPGLVMLLLIGVPKFKKIYNDFNTDPPVLTKYLLIASDVASDYVPLVAVALMAVMVADAVFSWHLGRNARPVWSFLWGASVSCLLVLALFLSILTLSIPFLH